MDERSLREKFQEELKKLSGMTWGQRLGYVWDYYKPLLAVILGVILLISIGVSIYQNLQINHLLGVYFINCNSLEIDSGEIMNDFSAYIGGIGAKDEIVIDTTTRLDSEDGSQYGVANQMKFAAVSAAGEIDVVVFDREQYERYRDSGSLTDLRTVLTDEQLELQAGDLEYGRDEESGREFVAALNVTDAPLIQKYNAYAGEEAFACIFANSTHQELAGTFLEYMFR